TMAVIGDGNHAGSFERTDWRQFFHGDALRDRASDKNVYDSLFCCALVNQRNRAGIVDRRRGVRHANYGSETASCGCGRSCGYRFFGSLTRLAQMDMEID